MTAAAPASDSDSLSKLTQLFLQLGQADCQLMTTTNSLRGGQVPRWQSTHWLPESAPASEAASGTKDRATDMADRVTMAVSGNASESDRGGGSGNDWSLLCTAWQDVPAGGSQLCINTRSSSSWSSLREHARNAHGLAANLLGNAVSSRDFHAPVRPHARLRETIATLGKDSESEGGDNLRLVHTLHLRATREDTGNDAGTSSQGDSGTKLAEEQQQTVTQSEVSATMTANHSHIEAEPQRLGLSRDRNRHYFNARHSELIRAWCCSFDCRSGSQSHSSGEGAVAGIYLP